MTKRSLIATTLQLIGVFLACDVIAKAMSFTAFGGTVGEMTADWVRIWTFNMAFWVVGLLFSVVLIFFASPIAVFLSRLTESDENSEVSFGAITPDLIVQLFGGFLLIRQSYFAVLEVISIFQFSNYGIGRFFVIFLYFAATIGVSICLIRCPDLLRRWRRSSPENNTAEQDSGGQPTTRSESK